MHAVKNKQQFLFLSWKKVSYNSRANAVSKSNMYNFEGKLEEKPAFMFQNLLPSIHLSQTS